MTKDIEEKYMYSKMAETWPKIKISKNKKQTLLLAISLTPFLDTAPSPIFLHIFFLSFPV